MEHEETSGNGNRLSTKAKILDEIEEVNDSPIEQVKLTVPIADDPTLPCLTFRTWVLGIICCALLAFVNQFFGYRQNMLYVTSISAQIVVLPIGRLMESVLPNKFIRFPRTKWAFSLNPGPFNLKEHVLITIFANAGSNTVFAVGIITIVKAFYHGRIDAVPAMLLTQTTQLLGYGWAGLFRKFLVDSPYMWWPSILVQVSLFRALHEVEIRRKGGLTRLQFFLVVLVSSFAYYIVPGYLFQSITALSFVCWIWKDSVTAQQVGSGLHGLGVGSFAIDWSTVAGFLGSPLATPGFAIINKLFGYIITLYIVIPIAYWTNSYGAKRFPIFSSHVFDAYGQPYDVSRVLNETTFEFDQPGYDGYSKVPNFNKVNLSIFFVYTYGLNFAILAAALTHVALFHGREIWHQTKAAYQTNLALMFTLPVGVLAATTNQQPELNVITELIIGYMYPGRLLANVTFKNYGYTSMSQAISFLSDFKLGHYMKIPPKSIFVVQTVGTLISSSVYFGTGWWLLTSVENICDPSKLPEGSQWTCPGVDVFYNASVIWGLVGPMRMFGRLGLYSKMNYFFLIGILAPVPVWILSLKFPEKTWIKYINVPIILSGTGGMPAVKAVNYMCWLSVGIVFNLVVYNRYRGWWVRHNYILSAGLDAGVAFSAVVLFFTLQMKNINGPTWWGLEVSDHCPLATCPTAPGIQVEGCPVFQ